MSFSSWLSRGLIASAMSGCMLLAGCGENSGTDANAKAETVKEVPVEAAAPALEVASNDSAMPEGDAKPAARRTAARKPAAAGDAKPAAKTTIKRVRKAKDEGGSAPSGEDQAGQ